MRVSETRFSRYILEGDGIVVALPLRTELPRTAELMAESLEGLAELIGDHPRPVLWDPRETLPLRPSGWQAIVDFIGGLVTSIAIVVDPGDENLLGAFPSVIDSLIVPVRTFTDEEAARSWLRQFLE